MRVPPTHRYVGRAPAPKFPCLVLDHGGLGDVPTRLDTVGVVSHIVVEREVPRRRDLLVAYRVVVDGAVVGQLLPGMASSLDVVPGEHQVRVEFRQLFRWRSPDVTVMLDEDSEVRMLVSNGDNAATPGLQGLRSPSQYLTLTVEPHRLAASGSPVPAWPVAHERTPSPHEVKERYRSAHRRLAVLAVAFAVVAFLCFVSGQGRGDLYLAGAVETILAAAFGLGARRAKRLSGA